MWRTVSSSRPWEALFISHLLLLVLLGIGSNPVKADGGARWGAMFTDSDSSSGSDNDAFLCESPVDLVLVLDGSGSILENDWEQMLQFCEQLIGNFNINSTMTRVGIIVFSDTAETIINLSGYGPSVLEALDELLYAQPKGNTDTSGGITAAEGLFLTEGRPGVPHIMLVVTDGGASTGDPGPAAEDAQALGTVMYAIGVGNSSTGLNLDQLYEIASKPAASHVYMVLDFNALSSLVHDISFKTCVFVTGVVPSSLPAGEPATLFVEGLGFRSSTTLTVRFTPTASNNNTTNGTTTLEREDDASSSESGSGSGVGSIDVKGNYINSTFISCIAPAGDPYSAMNVSISFDGHNFTTSGVTLSYGAKIDRCKPGWFVPADCKALAPLTPLQTKAISDISTGIVISIVVTPAVTAGASSCCWGLCTPKAFNLPLKAIVFLQMWFLPFTTNQAFTEIVDDLWASLHLVFGSPPISTSYQSELATGTANLTTFGSYLIYKGLAVIFLFVFPVMFFSLKQWRHVRGYKCMNFLDVRFPSVWISAFKLGFIPFLYSLSMVYIDLELTVSHDTAVAYIACFCCISFLFSLLFYYKWLAGPLKSYSKSAPAWRGYTQMLTCNMSLKRFRDICPKDDRPFSEKYLPCCVVLSEKGTAERGCCCGTELLPIADKNSIDSYYPLVDSYAHERKTLRVTDKARNALDYRWQIVKWVHQAVYTVMNVLMWKTTKAFPILFAIQATYTVLLFVVAPYRTRSKFWEEIVSTVGLLLQLLLVQVLIYASTSFEMLMGVTAFALVVVLLESGVIPLITFIKKDSEEDYSNKKKDKEDESNERTPLFSGTRPTRPNYSLGEAESGTNYSTGETFDEVSLANHPEAHLLQADVKMEINYDSQSVIPPVPEYSTGEAQPQYHQQAPIDPSTFIPPPPPGPGSQDYQPPPPSYGGDYNQGTPYHPPNRGFGQPPPLPPHGYQQHLPQPQVCNPPPPSQPGDYGQLEPPSTFEHQPQPILSPVSPTLAPPALPSDAERGTPSSSSSLSSLPQISTQQHIHPRTNSYSESTTSSAPPAPATPLSSTTTPDVPVLSSPVSSPAALPENTTPPPPHSPPPEVQSEVPGSESTEESKGDEDDE